jgi:hypothetical protein
MNLKGDNKDGHASPITLLIFKLKGDTFALVSPLCVALFHSLFVVRRKVSQSTRIVFNLLFAVKRIKDVVLNP